MKNYLEVINLSAGYLPKFPIISNFSLYAEDSECILISGRNGSGKTTLLKTIVGILNPIEGKIFINNKDLISLQLNKRKKLVSYAQQSPNYSTPIKVIEFLEFSITDDYLPKIIGNKVVFRGKISPKKTERLFLFIELFGIKELLNEPVSLLSEGQKKLVLLARTFIQGSKVIALDEPDAFLDITNQKLVSEAIRLTLNEGSIVLLISHNHSFYEKLITKEINIEKFSNKLFKNQKVYL